MIAVVFEVQPKQRFAGRCFDLAAELRQDLENADGFISVERFQSLTEDGKYLSLSFWRDHEAVAAWYAHAPHAAAQNQGRTEIFADYRIRVAEVLRDYDLAHGRPILPE